jgi:hypothetical protein
VDGSARRSVIGPAVAGLWYPARPERLAAEVDALLAGAAADAPAPPAPARALVVPHAGYAYSGAVAARGFLALARSRTRRVLLLGPSHRAAFAGAVAPRAAAYRTPLGEVEIDAPAAAGLPSGCFSLDDAPYAGEHALEAEIPFLQRRLEPGFRLLPLLVGQLGPPGPSAASLAAALRPWLGPDACVVVSSDFTHFGERFGYVPFADDVSRRIEALDRGAIERILAWDAAGFESYVERTRATICGRRAISILLRLFSDAPPGTLLAYDTSGRLTGDREHSVSYAAVGFDAPAGDAA